MVIRNVDAATRALLEACTGTTQPNDTGVVLQFESFPLTNGNEDLLITNIDISSATYINLSHAGLNLYHEVGPFRQTWVNFEHPDTNYMGWDVKKGAFVGIPATYEYASYESEDNFEEEIAKWQPCTGKDIVIPKYSEAAKKSYAFRIKAHGMYQQSRVYYFDNWGLVYDLGDSAYGNESLEDFYGIYWKVAVFDENGNENPPKAVIDLTEYAKDGKEISQVSYYVGPDSDDIKFIPVTSKISEEEKVAKLQAGESLIIEEPIQLGEKLYIQVGERIWGNTFEESSEHEAVSHLRILDGGRSLFFSDKLHNTEYLYQIDGIGDNSWKKATRSHVPTGFNGTNTVTVRVKGRNWFKSTDEIIWKYTISPSHPDVSNQDLISLKNRSMEFNPINNRLVVSVNWDDKLADFSYELRKTDGSTTNKVPFPQPLGENYILDLGGTLKDLEGAVLTLYKNETAITINFYKSEEELAIHPRRVPGKLLVGPINIFTDIKKQDEGNFSRTSDSEWINGKRYYKVEEPGIYELRTRAYWHDGYRRISFGKNNNPDIYGIYYPFGKNDFKIYLPSETSIVEVKATDEPGFLKDLVIEAYGLEQIVVRNVTEEFKKKLEASNIVVMEQGTDGGEPGRIVLQNILNTNDYVIKDIRVREGDNIIIYNEDEGVLRKIGPFTKTNMEVLNASGHYIGWDAQEEAIVGLEQDFEYAILQEGDFDINKAVGRMEQVERFQFQSMMRQLVSYMW